MKTILSILLGLMLLMSLVGTSYANPLQPAQSGGDANSCGNLSPNNPNYVSLGCAGAAHQQNPPSHGCAAPAARIGPDGAACCTIGRIAPDFACCVNGITPHGFEVSDIQGDVPICGGGY